MENYNSEFAEQVREVIQFVLDLARRPQIQLVIDYVRFSDIQHPDANVRANLVCNAISETREFIYSRSNDNTLAVTDAVRMIARSMYCPVYD
jgi:hypothetical protein